MNKFLAICLFVFLGGPLYAQVSVNTLKCEYLEAPLGVESLHPQLSWQLASPQRNVTQTAYRILVADNPAFLKNNTGNVWDTKKVKSDQSIQVTYAGIKLQPVKTYYWKVMVWDNHNHVSSWSTPSSWQMGLLTAGDWKGAKWIAYERLPDSLRILPRQGDQNRIKGKSILPLFRKTFALKKTVKKATVYITGLGHFDLSLNGKKVGDHFLDAGWTEYEKHALYVTFDITKQLKPGANTLGVMLGNGFYYIPSERYWKLTVAYGYPKLICRTVLNYTDGTSEDIVSDNSWKVSPGPVTFSSIYGGEDYDATLEQQGWNTLSFNDKAWARALVVDGPEQLSAQTATPLKFFDTFVPKKITQPIPGVWVYDLGQNASGIPRIVVKGKAGSTVRLKPAELLAKDGTITTKPIGTPVFFNYTLKGEGTESWQPQFMYYGFRYVQVEGAVPEGEPNPGNLPVVSGIYGVHTRNSAARIGEFTSSNDLFNKTFTLIDWAIKSNMSSVFTDCPHREKLGWLEEAHLVGASIRYNYDIPAICRKIVRDMINAQTPDGLVTSIAPEYARFGGPFRDSPEWGSNAVIMPWYLYQWYGDKEVLEEAYPMMQRYMTYLQSKSRNNILSHGLGDWYDIGPKEPGPSQLTPHGITATAIYYYDLTILEKIATMLGKPADATAYRELASQVKSAYNTAFFNKTAMTYGTGSQTANAMSVYMGLVEPEYKSAVVDNIVKEIKARNNSLTAGDIGYRYLLRVLDDNGRSDVIYDMNSNAAVPGYGYQLAKGATALTESWQAYDNASNNHFMLGHLMEWFYSGLGGIRPAENAPAFKKIVIRPELVGDVTYAKATTETPYGRLTNNWKKTGGNLELNVVIPPNTSAVVYLPGTKNSRITESGKSLPASRLTYENDRVLVAVGSGNYKFTVEN